MRKKRGAATGRRAIGRVSVLVLLRLIVPSRLRPDGSERVTSAIGERAPGEVVQELVEIDRPLLDVVSTDEGFPEPVVRAVDLREPGVLLEDGLVPSRRGIARV